MVSAKLCFALVVCALVLISCAEAHNAKHHATAKSSKARAEEGLEAKADTLRARLETVANVAGALMSRDDDGGFKWPTLDTCYAGYMCTKCTE